VSDWVSYFEQFWDERLNTLKDIIEAKQGDNNV